MRQPIAVVWRPEHVPLLTSWLPEYPGRVLALDASTYDAVGELDTRLHARINAADLGGWPPVTDAEADVEAFRIQLSQHLERADAALREIPEKKTEFETLPPLDALWKIQLTTWSRTVVRSVLQADWLKRLDGDLTLFLPDGDKLDHAIWNDQGSLPRDVIAARAADTHIRTLGIAEPTYAPPMTVTDGEKALAKLADRWSPTTLFATLGVPDVLMRLRQLALCRRNVLCLVDPYLGGDIGAITRAASRFPSVSIITPDDLAARKENLASANDPNDLAGRARDEAGIMFPNAQAKIFAALAGKSLHAYRQLADGIDQLVRETSINEIVTSDHASPTGAILMHTAKRYGLPVCHLAHSAFPLAPSFRLDTGRGDGGKKPSCAAFAGWTRAANRSAVTGESAAYARSHLAPPLTLAPFYVRPRTVFRKHLHAFGRKRLGVLLTVETVEAVADIVAPLRQLIDELASANESRPGPYIIEIRMRAGVETASYVRDALNLSDGRGKNGTAITFSSSDQEQIVVFLNRCAVVVEVGNRTAARLDAFAALTPIVRLDAPQRDQDELGMPPRLVPALRADRCKTQLHKLTSYGPARLGLIVRQHLWLLRNTLSLPSCLPRGRRNGA
ncbi:MAG: hypothetical protein AAFQ42_01685 [Pseudomonadota bacterium]